jgi:AraC family transcriptional regulator
MTCDANALLPAPTAVPSDRLNAAPRFDEANDRESIGSGGRPLYESGHDAGFRLAWHDFERAHEVDWAKGFRSGSVTICLNLSGNGRVVHAQEPSDFAPLTAGFYVQRKTSLNAWRSSDQRHQFITVEFSPRFLRQQLSPCDGALHPLVDETVRENKRLAGISEIRRLTAEHQQLIRRLMRPPVSQGARPLWYQSKALELMAEFFFERHGEDELFCDRQKRVARERVDRVVAILRERLAEPPSLEEIGREAGCSPFYLSRIFSKETGMTIPQFLRQIRMERAAELLRSGKYNVTEAALEVGYSSLSHFSQAFCRTIGCCPNLYPQAKALVKKQFFAEVENTSASS